MKFHQKSGVIFSSFSCELTGMILWGQNTDVVHSNGVKGQYGPVSIRGPLEATLGLMYLIKNCEEGGGGSGGGGSAGIEVHVDLGSLPS